MRTIYIDSDFKCHVTDDGTLTAVGTDSFDGKCDTFVEGYRFVPAGEVWTRPGGVVFTGEMIAPWKDYSELIAAQEAYEKAQLQEKISTLESDNKMLNAQVTALTEQNDFQEELIVELANIVYA